MWSQALAEGHTHGSQMTISGVLLWQGWGWLQRGASEEAEEGLRRYRGAVQRRGGEHEAGAAYGIGFLTRVLVARGELAEARRLAELPRESAAGSDGDLQQVRGVVEVLLADGRWPEALAALDAVPRRRRPVVNPVWAPWGSLAARALVRVGPHGGGAGAGGRGGRRPRGRGGRRPAWGPRCAPSGSRSTWPGRPDAQAAFEEAVAVDRGVRRAAGARRLAARPRELAAARQAADAGPGAAGARGGPRRGVRGHAARGAGRRRSSAPPVGSGSRGTPPGVDALTPSERRVAALAASGRSNKAIAQELFVTTKTVEVHLSNTYRKLGVASRADLAAASRRLGVRFGSSPDAVGRRPRRGWARWKREPSACASTSSSKGRSSPARWPTATAAPCGRSRAALA